MKIAIINGSPKGKNSVTLEYVKYIQKHFPQHTYQELNVALEVGKMEKERDLFHKSIAAIKEADAVIWSFPLYVMLVSSQCKRWIEMIWEEGLETAFVGKPCIVVSTSIHFYDDTAHNYLRAICDDLQMRYIGGYAAEMYDLMKGKERQRFLAFVDIFFDAIAKGYAPAPVFAPLPIPPADYTPSQAVQRIDLKGSRILILTEGRDKNDNLAKMVARVRTTLVGQVEVIYLEDINIQGGCIGCCVCGLDNECFYRDGYKDFYCNIYKKADAIIYACRVRDRFLSAIWKQFIDRSFFNGHVPTLLGRQMGFILAGALGKTDNIRTIISAYAGFQKANLVDIVSDEAGASAAIDARLDNFCALLASYLERDYIAPPNFLTIGGSKLFRDEIYGKLRFVFQADHKYYKKHGYYDFPQNDYKVRGRNFMIMLLTKLPFFRGEFLKRIVPEMVAPLRHIVKKK